MTLYAAVISLSIKRLHLDRLYRFAKYLVASSAIRATLDMFLAVTFILADADMNHSGDFGT